MKTNIIDYLEYLKTTKRLSDGTVDAYRSDIEKFFNFCISVGIKNPDKVKIEQINNYIKYMEDGGFSTSSVNRSVTAIKSYYKYLNKTGKTDKDITSGVRPIGQKTSQPVILERDEVVKLLEAPSGDTFKAKRDKVMLELLYATGMKVSELVELLPENVNLRFNLIKIESERHERTVPIYPEAAKHLSEYIKVYRPAIADEGTKYLFTNLNGKQLSRQGIWKIIKHYAESAGITKTITPHTLRHSFAVHLLENGADINDIKEMMGHLDISSTFYYSNMLKNKFNKGYAKFHPLSKR